MKASPAFPHWWKWYHSLIALLLFLAIIFYPFYLLVYWLFTNGHATTGEILVAVVGIVIGDGLLYLLTSLFSRGSQKKVEELLDEVKKTNKAINSLVEEMKKERERKELAGSD